jgi:DNA adenine methylase
MQSETNGRDMTGIQAGLLEEIPGILVQPFKQGLLKWVGSKLKMAHAVASFFPPDFKTYHEPFLGSAAVLGALRPRAAIGSDSFQPVVEIWQTLRANPDRLKAWYRERYLELHAGEKVEQYERIKARYNANPNGADILFLCRSCYAGIVRFRQKDGHMSTPCGPHKPMPPQAFSLRVDDWHARTAGARFYRMDYREAMEQAKAGDFIYCDPPYAHSQAILYGAQQFKLAELFEAIQRAKTRGVKVALSIDGTKRSGSHTCAITLPSGLFEEEILIDCGRSMLRRLQMVGQTLENEEVADRLLLTY